MIKNIIAGGVLIAFLGFLFYPKDDDTNGVQSEEIANAPIETLSTIKVKKAPPTAVAPQNNQPQNEFVFGQPMSDGSPVSFDEGTSRPDMSDEEKAIAAKPQPKIINQAQTQRRKPSSSNRAASRPTAPRTKKDGQPTVVTGPAQKPKSHNPPRTIGGIKMEYANGSYSPVDGQVGSKSNPIGSGATN